MSTRAIIGIQNADGTITAGWQWSDGMRLIPLLKRQFSTKEKVIELVKNGVWNTIVAPNDKETLDTFKNWTTRTNSAYYLVKIGKCHILKEKPVDTAAFCFTGDTGVLVNDDGSLQFKDFATAYGQDINYLYLFYPDKQEWKVFR